MPNPAAKPHKARNRVDRINRALTDLPGSKLRLANILGLSQSHVSNILSGLYKCTPEFEMAAYALIEEIQAEQDAIEAELDPAADKVLGAPQ